MNISQLLQKDPKQQKIAIGILGVIIIIVAQTVYWLIQYFVPPRYDFTCSLDLMIPFVPWMLIVYLSIYLFIIVCLISIDPKDILLIMIAGCVTCVCAWLCFIIFPAAIERPDPQSIENPFWRFAFSILHKLDATTNTLPSLHIAVSWLCAFALWNHRHLWIAILTAIAISLSTLLTKQHLVADVVSGFLLAFISWYIVVRKDIFKFSDSHT